MTRTRGPSGEWRHWPVLLASIAGIMLAAVNGYSLGVIMGPLEREFGWSRTEISMGPMIIAMMGLVGAPVAGIAIDRFGPRRIAAIGVVAFCGALALLSRAGPDIWSWWLHWALLGVASMLLVTTVWAAALNSLFSVHRGKALAFALCGTGLSAAVTPLATSALVTEYGWRGAYIGLAVIGGVIVFPLVLLFFRAARDTVVHDAAVEITGFDVREGLAAPSFRKLAAAVLLFAVSSIALTVNAVPVLDSQGFDTATAAWLAGLIGIGSIVGRLGGGFLLDRFDAKKVAAAAAVSPVVTALLLTLFPGSVGPVAVAALFLGLSAGTEVDACGYLAARHLGMRKFGTLFGMINGVVLFGSGAAPVAANYIYDVTGTYHLLLIAVVPVSLVAAMLFASLGRYPDWSADVAPASSGASVLPAGSSPSVAG
ncbi:MFS transporter [Novosphingobium album (ex Liu et al. 2023)]|uniref:MFS transporter n=1 Tax=Novosphingobium album (ex Liu et al. 2023) TaxID=3031130 RepID=A0ABT5WP02_9SPHN|nr:MFS transporter [Novosphingobium album (ex Liu et al. 2023)]MDE8650997.1 MFS transporter [Novosphingobium album (ex Liu et al. 2023)]